MRPFSARDVDSALKQKGFIANSKKKDHVYYHYRYSGRDVGVSTKISFGEREIGFRLGVRMRKQMMLTKNEDFVRFVECPMSQKDYEEHLFSVGIIT